MNQELRHEVTMVVNGESRKVMVDSEPQPCGDGCDGCGYCMRNSGAPAENQQVPAPVAANPKPAAKKTAQQKPSLLQRAKSAVTGKGKKA
jgi:hypothetical protein